MSINPDIKAERDRNRVIFNDDQDRRIPVVGELRFINRDSSAILQQYQWSNEDSDHNWYDVPLSE